MSTLILQKLPCMICTLSVLTVYALQIVKEWREYHPKRRLGTASARISSHSAALDGENMFVADSGQRLSNASDSLPLAQVPILNY